MIRSKIDDERSRLPELVDLRWQKPGALRRAWPDLSETQRKIALGALVESIIVRPRRPGDKAEDRVEILFKP